MASADGQANQLFLVRHAQSANNAQEDSNRVCDPSITDLGWNQAKTLGQHLASIPFESLMTSAFRRALQTASQIRELADLVPEIIVDVHEHGGCYEGWHEDNFEGQPGMTAEEIHSEFGPVTIPHNYPISGWWESKPRESHQASNDRANKMSQYLRKRLMAAAGNLVCVTHADFLGKLLLSMFGNSIQENEHYFDLKNVGITTVGLEGSTWKLYELNSVEFLPADWISS